MPIQQYLIFYPNHNEASRLVLSWFSNNGFCLSISWVGSPQLGKPGFEQAMCKGLSEQCSLSTLLLAQTNPLAVEAECY